MNISDCGSFDFEGLVEVARPQSLLIASLHQRPLKPTKYNVSSFLHLQSTTLDGRSIDEVDLGQRMIRTDL